MQKRVFAVLAIIIVLTAFSLSIGNSLQQSYVTLQSSGIVQQPVAGYGPSEIRGVFVKWLNAGTTWETLAASYEPYGVNWLVGESFGTHWSRSNLDSINVHNQQYDYIGEGIKAAHAHGMKFTAMMLVGYREGGTIDSATDIVDQNGQLQLWTCPVKAHNLIISIVKEVATKYPALDGFMFDYIRYTTDNDWGMCYCEQCRQRFVADTGLTDTVWSTDVVAGGKYFMQFLEWRVGPITELVRDVHDAMLAINPNLEFSIAALGLWYENGVGYGYPIRQWFGQDTADMVTQGYLDVVCPMLYTSDTTAFTNQEQTSRKYMVGGVEGKVAYVPIIGGIEDSGNNISPSQLKSIVDTCRTLGTDGFLIYRGNTPNFVSNYLAPLTNNPVFTMSNLQAQKNNGSVTFTWTTSSQTNSTVEYSTSPLFYTQTRYYGEFKYYEVTHSASSSKYQSAELTTTHSITTPSDGTTPIYFRVQSADAYNVLSTPQLIYNPEGNNITP